MSLRRFDRLMRAALVLHLGPAVTVSGQDVPQPSTVVRPQSASVPLSSDGELRELLELAHLHISAPLPPVETVGLSLRDVALLSDSVPELANRLAWTGSGVSSVLGADPGVGTSGAAAFELRMGGRWGGGALYEPGSGPLLGAAMRAWVGTHLGFAADVEGGGGREEYDGLRQLVATLRFGGAVLTAGRSRPRLGPGRDDLILSGIHPVDGLGLASAGAFRLPGPLRIVGELNVASSVHRVDRVGGIEDPWFGVFALSVDPTPWWRIGLSRTAVFGGAGLPPVTVGRVARMIAGWHSTNQGEFEDQYAELFTRVRLELVGLPLVTYIAFAVNDSEAAYRDDPGLLVGILLPVPPERWFGAVRYEYVSFGPGANLCFWCDAGRPRSWFRHYVFGAHEMSGLPIASRLGGYGARHLLRWRGWPREGRWSVEAELYHEDRDATNILLDRWPGTRVGMHVGAGVHPRAGLLIEARVGAARPEDGDVEGTLELHGTWTALGYRSTP